MMIYKLCSSIIKCGRKIKQQQHQTQSDYIHARTQTQTKECVHEIGINTHKTNTLRTYIMPCNKWIYDSCSQEVFLFFVESFQQEHFFFSLQFSFINNTQSSAHDSNSFIIWKFSNHNEIDIQFKVHLQWWYK